MEDHSPISAPAGNPGNYEYVPEQYDFTGPYEDHHKPKEDQRYPESNNFGSDVHHQDNKHNPFDEGIHRTHQQEATKFNNSPYHKQAKPYSVVDVLHDPIPKNTESDIKLNSNDDYPPEQHDARSSAELVVPHDYYDNLYEEFMEAAYDSDYYDHHDASGNKKEKTAKNSKMHDRHHKPVMTDDMDVRNSKSQLGSHTRRDPPSDMYTTSRSTVEPNNIITASNEALLTVTRSRPAVVSNEPNEDLPNEDQFLESKHAILLYLV